MRKSLVAAVGLFLVAGQGWALNSGGYSIEKGKWSVGFEANAVSIEELKLENDPNYKESETTIYKDGTTEGTIIEGNYFNWTESSFSSTSTYTRDWTEIKNISNILAFKIGYGVTENFEPFVKLGMRDRRIYITEEVTRNSIFSGSSNKYQEKNEESYFNTPYNFLWVVGANFDFLKENIVGLKTSAQFSHVKNKQESVYYYLSSSSEDITKWKWSADEQTLQISALASLNLNSPLKPYTGIAYIAQKIKYVDEWNGNDKNLESVSPVDRVEGNRKTEATFKPKTNISGVVGVNLDIAKSALLNVELKFLGETSVSVAGSYKF